MARVVDLQEPAVGGFGLEVRIDCQGDGLAVLLSGELAAESAPALRRQIDDWPVVARTTIDLTEVTFVDSMGIGCLLKLQRRVSDAGGVLEARGASPGIRRTLTLTGLHRLLAFVD